MTGSSSSVQFKSKDAVIEAYNNRDVEAWSISQGKQFMFKGLGEAELAPVIDALCDGGTNAIYTLRVYEDVEDKKSIKENTASDGSFNFRLNSENQEITNKQYWNNTNRETILEKLAKIEERLNHDEETEAPGGSLGKVGDILNHPAILPVVPVLIEKVLSALLGGNNPAPQPQLNYRPTALAGVPSKDNEALITDSIEKLKLHDPELGLHLSKLVEIAETNPTVFKALINSLQ